MDSNKIYLRDLSQEELSSLAVSLGGKPFNGKQIFSWLHKGVADIENMSDLSMSLRGSLEEKTQVNALRLLKVEKSRVDGTGKYLFGLEDGSTFESVFMKYKYGNSICLSTQAGCRMGCSFCASGIDGLSRNLSSGHMVEQVIRVAQEEGEEIRHVVFMGTGEPFDNYENVSKAIELLGAKGGLNLSLRNITVSTCGIVPKIEAFGNDFPQVNLAISLHAPMDSLRSAIMPINHSYPLSKLMPACWEYTNKTGRRLTFEYAMIGGVNDSKAHGEALAGLLKGHLAHVNLIPLNGVEESGLRPSGPKAVKSFVEILEGRGITTTVRRELGSDIHAACGQLRLREGKEDKD